MPTLARYRKKGGFRQLLLLVESSNLKKQQSLLNVVESEDPAWANKIRERMLTLEKFFEWDAEDIERVLAELDPGIWVKAMFIWPGLEERQSRVEKACQFMTRARQNEILAHLAELQPKPAEVESAKLMIIKKARDLQSAGYITPESKDPSAALKDLEDII